MQPAVGTHVMSTSSTAGAPGFATPPVADRNGAVTLAPMRHEISRHANVAKRMAIDVSVVRDLEALRAIEAEWRALAAGPGALFRGPDWLLPWWSAYHATLGAELHVLVGRASEPDEATGVAPGDIVCLAPLYRRTVRVALLDTTELRMIGDAATRYRPRSTCSRAGWEDRAGAALARKLIDDAGAWDVLDLEPLADPSRVRANLVQRLAPAGFAVESAPSAGGASRIALALAPVDEQGEATGVGALPALPVGRGPPPVATTRPTVAA